MKKLLLALGIFTFFNLVSIQPAYAADFTVSNVNLNISTNEISWDITPTDLFPEANTSDYFNQALYISSTIDDSGVLSSYLHGDMGFAQVSCIRSGHCAGLINEWHGTMLPYDTQAGPQYILANDYIKLDICVPGTCLTSDYISTSNLTVSGFPVKIVSSPSSGSKTVGQPFTVDVKVEDSGEAFNAARANVSVSSNLTVTGIHNATANACNLQYTKAPTKENPSFAGAIFGNSSEGCTVYTITFTPNAEGTGTVTFSNGSVKAYTDNSEILTGVTNASFTLTNGATATPTPMLEFQVTNPLQTYKTNFNLTGTKLTSITHIFVNGSEEDSTYPTNTTWEVPVTLNLGENNFTIYGKDESNNQTATQTTTVDRHTLGDINGDGEINLIDASLFAVDWDKTEDLTYILSDMNDDGNVDLTDLSILAKLE